MRVLRMPDELAKRYLSVRQSYDSARNALLVALPDVPTEERYDFYVNAYRDLCDCSIAMAVVEEEIFRTFGISSFERIELNEIYTLEDVNDDGREA